MKLAIRRILNLLLYLSLCVMAGTGLLMQYRLIPGNRGGQGLQLLGWNRHEWGDIHTWAAYVFVALVMVHLVMNWSWLVKIAGSGRAWPLAAGLIAGIAIVAAFLLLPVSRKPQGGRPARQGAVEVRDAYVRVSNPPLERPTFEKDVLPVLRKACVSCHGPKKQKAGFRADRRDDFFADDEDGPLVVAGDSGKSRIVAIVSGELEIGHAKDHVLSPAEVSLIKAWIDAGAG